MSDITKEQAINICVIAGGLLEKFRDAEKALSLAANAESEVAALEQRKAAISADLQQFIAVVNAQKSDLQSEMDTIRGESAKLKAAIAEQLSAQTAAAEAKIKAANEKLAAVEQEVSVKIAEAEARLNDAVSKHSEVMAGLAKEKAQAEADTNNAKMLLRKTKDELNSVLAIL